ncbi:ATPase [Longispora fulva]|uniref:histidine kinase n=1 Tax=Longispora fulva TaxID=619741 RepID=A0A8J7GJA4_9ACTN|nr:histidine kinase [Longispora fulva]MBG6137797.1 signal transduction histidine kinase [Longispora fulva]GIG62045.1 ATPase [Longispora fulva]
MGTGGALLRRVARIDPLVWDTLLATAIAGLTIAVGILFLPDGFRRFDGEAWLLTLLVNLPMAGRRRYPMMILGFSCLSFVVFLAEGYLPSINFFGPLLGLYTVATLYPTRRVVPVAVVTFGVLQYSGMSARILPWYVIAFQMALVTSVACVFGGRNRMIGERNARLAVLTARLRRDQEERARRAVTEERIRIAREMHDVVAHHMSVISLQAGLARYVFHTDPNTALGAVETIESTSGAGLEELRRLLLVLRVGEGEETGGGERPPAGLDRLDELAARVTASGVPVTLAVTGEPRPLPPGAELCAYRVTQEALTNVLKHAAGARATVDLHYGPRTVTVRVVDDGRAAGPPAESTGQGLVGMRERARMYGGTLSAGPRDGGGFAVELVLPTVALVEEDSR